MSEFNRHMMILARDSRGMTQSSLAEKLKVRQGTISKYEAGLSVPSEDFVSDLSIALRYKPTFFYESGRPYGMPPFHYRKRKKLSAKALSQIVAEINIRRLHVGKLLLSFEHRRSSNIPEIDRDEYVGASRQPFSIEEAAQQLRSHWGIYPGPVPNLMELLEEAGGIVIPCDFGTDLLDAISQRIDGMPVLFFVNINAPADRVRYTLAHELGHMVLHTANPLSDEEMEDEADAFAGAFLLPEDDIRPQLRRFNLRHVSNMKRYWGVSMQAIATRASRLGLITQHQSKHFYIELGRLGWRKREPNEPPKERPKLLRKMLEFHRRQLGYSPADIADLFGMQEGEIERMYADDYFAPEPPRNTPNLRVVK